MYKEISTFIDSECPPRPSPPLEKKNSEYGNSMKICYISRHFISYSLKLTLEGALMMNFLSIEEILSFKIERFYCKIMHAN